MVIGVESLNENHDGIQKIAARAQVIPAYVSEYKGKGLKGL
jgi:hypothetical protein